MACYEMTVPQQANGLRIDVFIRKYMPEISTLATQQAFRRRDVKVNGTRVKQDHRVSQDDQIQVYCMQQEDTLDIVYEDEDVIIVNKRSGVSVVEDDPESTGGATLTEIVSRHLGGEFCAPCHRLDNKTCGIVVFAKNQRAMDILTDAFHDRTLDKRYVCLVRGMMKPPSAVCKAFLKKDAAKGLVTIYDHEIPGARTIVTGYETIEQGPVSRLSVHLITGRTHQIRAHMAALGHPLLGDDLYGDRAFNRVQHARRLMLCAYSLTIDTRGRLPSLDGKHFEIKCPF